MGGPNSTITVSLVAQTEAAQARLDAFFAKLKSQLVAGNAPVTFLAPAQVGAAASALKKLEESAQGLNTRIAGMSYYFRSAIDGIRVAAAGGGARAGFYAIDEAVRGLIASGLGLSVLIPVLAAVAAAVGGGYLVWREYTSSEREAAKAAQELHDKIKGIKDLMVQMQDMQKAGILSPEAVQRNLDILSGKIKLYRDSEGNVTQNATSTLNTAGIIPGKPKTYTTENKQLTGPDLVKYLQDQFAVPGGNDPEENAAKAKLEALRSEIHAKTISDTEAEIVKIHQKYQAERDEIDSTSTEMGKLLTPAQRSQNEKAKAESLANEQIEVARKREEAIEKINEQTAAAHANFARVANEKLDKDIVESASIQGKSRAEIFQEEYNKRVALLLTLKSIGILNEQQYTDAVMEAQAKRLEGEKREEDELRRIGELKDQISKKDYDFQRRAIEQNPFLTDSQKIAGQLKENQSHQQDVLGNLADNQSALAAPENSGLEQQIALLSQRRQLQSDYNGLILEQQKLQLESGNSFKESFGAMFTKMKSEAEINFNTLASTFKNVFDSASQAVTQGITRWIMGTETWKKALLDIGETILTDLVQAIVGMAVRWIATQVMMAIAGKALMAAGVAAQAPMALASTLMWSTPATLATIATYGAAAAQAPELITIAEGATLIGSLAGFAEGGFTGPGARDEVAGLVHRGEFVIPAERVEELGLGFFHKIHSGDFSPRSAPVPSSSDSQGPGGSVVHHTTEMHLAIVDSEEAAKRVLDGEHGEKFWLSMADKHISKFQR